MGLLLSSGSAAQSAPSKDSSKCDPDALIIKTKKSVSSPVKVGDSDIAVSVIKAYSWQNNMPSPEPVHRVPTTLISLKITNNSNEASELELQSNVLFDGSSRQAGAKFEEFMPNEALAPGEKPQLIPPARFDKAGKKLSLKAHESTMVTVRFSNVDYARNYVLLLKDKSQILKVAARAPEIEQVD
jgi:hypothetical protein